MPRVDIETIDGRTVVKIENSICNWGLLPDGVSESDLQKAIAETYMGLFAEGAD